MKRAVICVAVLVGFVVSGMAALKYEIKFVDGKNKDVKVADVIVSTAPATMDIVVNESLTKKQLIAVINDSLRKNIIFSDREMIINEGLKKMGLVFGDLISILNPQLANQQQQQQQKSK